MKTINILSIFSFALFISCATQTKKDVVAEALKTPAKSYEQKRTLLKQILDKHPEFTQKQKSKIETIVGNSLETSEALRKQESQIIVKILKKSVVDQNSYGDLVKLKDALDDTYKSKSKNFHAMVKSLKKEIGIKPTNQDILNDFNTAGFFR